MTISEVSAKYEITTDTLRYYEKVGLLPFVRRTSGGIRNYSEIDCQWVEFIKCMRSAGLSIDVLIEYIRLFQEGDETAEARKELLVTQRDMLVEKVEEIQKTIDRLNYKIEGYEKFMIQKEKELSGSDV